MFFWLKGGGGLIVISKGRLHTTFQPCEWTRWGQIRLATKLKFNILLHTLVFAQFTRMPLLDSISKQSASSTLRFCTRWRTCSALLDNFPFQILCRLCLDWNDQTEYATIKWKGMFERVQHESYLPILSHLEKREPYINIKQNSCTKSKVASSEVQH